MELLENLKTQERLLESLMTEGHLAFPLSWLFYFQTVLDLRMAASFPERRTTFRSELPVLLRLHWEDWALLAEKEEYRIQLFI